MKPSLMGLHPLVLLCEDCLDHPEYQSKRRRPVKAEYGAYDPAAQNFVF